MRGEEPPVSQEVPRALRAVPTPRGEDGAHVRSPSNHGVPQGTAHVELLQALRGHATMRTPMQRQVRAVQEQERARQGMSAEGKWPVAYYSRPPPPPEALNKHALLSPVGFLFPRWKV